MSILNPLYGAVAWVMAQIHAGLSLFLPSTSGEAWFLTIVLLVVLMRLILVPLFIKQMHSMRKMSALNPQLMELRKKYKGDKQTLNEETMRLYRENGVNPLGGCLPTLIQIPVFFALYYVLLESVELRHAPFFGWIQNLSAPDPYYILPIINMAVMAGTMLFTPPSPGMDATQQKMMKFMPIAFSLLFFVFPSGLVLYYAVNGGLGLLQQWVINHRMLGAEARTAR